MIRSITLGAVFVTSISGTAFSMIQKNLRCTGLDADKTIVIESLLAQDDSAYSFLWTTGLVASPREYESGSINMFPSQLRSFSYDGTVLNISLADYWTPARIELQYNFKTQKGEGKVVVPTQRFGVEVQGTARLSCNVITSEVKRTLPQPPMSSGIYDFQLPSDSAVSIALQVEETQITLQVVGSPEKVVLTSKDGLTWKSTDARCPVILQSTTGTGRTSDSFYITEPTACEYAKNLGISLAGPYRLAH